MKFILHKIILEFFFYFIVLVHSNRFLFSLSDLFDYHLKPTSRKHRRNLFEQDSFTTAAKYSKAFIHNKFGIIKFDFVKKNQNNCQRQRRRTREICTIKYKSFFFELVCTQEKTKQEINKYVNFFPLFSSKK